MRHVLYIFVLITMTGCFSGRHNTPSRQECMYRCTKCGKHVLMLNPVLRTEPCPEGGTHQWQHHLR